MDISELPPQTIALLHQCEEALQEVIVQLGLRRVAVFVAVHQDVIIEWRNENLTLWLSMEGNAPSLEASFDKPSGHVWSIWLNRYIWSRLDSAQKLKAQKTKSLQGILEYTAEHMLTFGVPAIQMLQSASGFLSDLSPEEAAEFRQSLTT